MLSLVKKFYDFLIALGTCLQPFVLLLIRLYWGWLFFQTGLGKLGDIGAIAAYFSKLSIPYPLFNAYLAAYVECVGGLCLLIGLASRLVAIPLIVTMCVAYLTAHHEAVSQLFFNPADFVSKTPFNFLLASLLIFAFGPGLLSLDAFFKGLRKSLSKSQT